MIPKEIEAIKRRCEAATPGPWWDSGKSVVRDSNGENGNIICILRKTKSSEDTDFIAHAREDVPKLLKEVKRWMDLSSRLLSIVDELHPADGNFYAEEADRFNDLIAEMRRALRRNEEIMALAKCNSCVAPKVAPPISLSSRLARFFVEWVPFLEAFVLIRFVNPRAPLNYPKTSVICGSNGCENPALIWLTQAEEYHYYESEKRIFELESQRVKVRVR